MSKMNRIKKISDHFQNELSRINEIPRCTYTAKDNSLKEAEKEFASLGKKQKEEKEKLIIDTKNMLKGTGMEVIELKEVVGQSGKEWSLTFKLKHTIQAQGNPILAFLHHVGQGEN